MLFYRLAVHAPCRGDCDRHRERFWLSWCHPADVHISRHLHNRRWWNLCKLDVLSPIRSNILLGVASRNSDFLLLIKRASVLNILEKLFQAKRYSQKIASPLISTLNAYLFFFFLVSNCFIEFDIHFHCKLSNKSERRYTTLKNGLCIKNKTMHCFMAYNDIYINGTMSIMWDMAFRTVLWLAILKCSRSSRYIR